ncbi:hypothetical protein M3Y99_00142700 [Aphelenchoides fujianensis]|nr:hypothetical protein M3Y99_00142700 [Aphelenchoides fujianensis]
MRTRRAFNRLLLFFSFFLFVLPSSTTRLRAKRSREQLFPYGQRAVYRWNELYVEELAEKPNVEPSPALVELGFSFFVADRARGSPDDVYGRAVANLRRAAPNLDIFWLIGGHHFTPAHKTASALRAELLDVAANLRAFTRALSATPWRLFSHTSEVPRERNSIRYILFAHMNEEFVNSGALVPLVAQTLEHAATRRELADRYFVTTHVWNGVKVFLELGVFTTTPSLHPVGRTKLLDGDHLINAGPECQRDGNLNCGGGPKNAA